MYIFPAQREHAMQQCTIVCVQRLAEDRNPAIAAAASRTIQELKRQWEIEDGDSWRFMVNQIPMEDEYSKEEDED